jgi:predicted site-specific integrase-resolvase
MKIIPVSEWAKREEVQRRLAYKWIESGLLPIGKAKITITGIPANITKEDIGKGKSGD